jgi:transcriptional regulator with XRE-family HTH domain
MKKIRTYSSYTQDALMLFGQLIKLGRKSRHFSEATLAERAGISRATVQKIENGDSGVAIGLVFECAVIVGVVLFNSPEASITLDIDRLKDKLALLPKAIHSVKTEVDDDF